MFYIFCMVFDAWKVEIIETIGVIAIVEAIATIETIIIT